MHDFFIQLGEISPILPPLVRIILIAIVGMLSWFVISIPAYLLSQSLGSFLEAVQLGLLSAWGSLRSLAVAIKEAASTIINQFVDAHALMYSFANENRAIEKSLSEIRESTLAIPTRIDALQNVIARSSNDFARSADSLNEIVPHPELQPPSSKAFTEVMKGRNSAAVILVIAIILTPAFILFNTGMLSQFLDGFFPGMEYAGVPLSIILSSFATLVEIGLGILLVAIPYKPAQVLWYASLAGLAFLELSFYARLGQGFNWSMFDAFYAPNAAPAWTKLWFGVFGPILVACLAGAGHALFSSIAQLSEQHVVRQWKTHITDRMRSATELRQRLTMHNRIFRDEILLPRQAGVIASTLPSVTKISESVRRQS